ncbi:HAD family hydrolase [candidate division KSB1 bacterium]|nr:MAG: HAD family hydrolase [candidate division KSB1 bacterium]
MLKRWQAVIFDLDDTLYAERDYVLSGFRAVSLWAEAHLGVSADEGFVELKALFDQGVRGNTFDRWLATHSVQTNGTAQRLVEVYRSHEPTLTPFAEVPALLLSLKKTFRVGLLSDGYLEVQQRKLCALKLAHYFDALVFSDEWGREAWKPSVTPFSGILVRLKTDASTSIYVGDNPVKDFLGARELGMFTIWIKRSEGIYASMQPPTAKHAPDLTLKSLDELQTFLAQ